MWKKLINLSALYFFLLSTFSLKFVECKRTYLVVGSQTLPYQGKYSVAVSSFGYEKPENIQIKLLGKLDSGKTYENIKNVTLKNGALELVEFDLKNQTPGNYFIKIRNQTSEQSMRLNLNTKKYSVYIQTDKALYKPGDKVQFRVLVLNVDTKPFMTNEIEIFITDANDNRVKQYDKIIFRTGVFKQEMQLSDEVVLGLWNIHVIVNGDSGTVKSFEVDEYVLPKFEVNVVTKSKISKVEDIVVSYSAKYTYGKDVDGTAIVSAEVINDWWWWGGSQSKKVVKTLNNSTKTTSISLKNDLNLQDVNWMRSVSIIITFTEALTGIQRNASTTVQIYENPYTVTLESSSDRAKPQIPIIIKAFVKDINEVPVTDDKAPISFNVTFSLDSYNFIDKRPAGPFIPVWRPPETEIISFVRYLKNGIAEIPFTINENVTSVEVSASYKEVFGYLWEGTSPTESNQYIEIKLPSGTLSATKTFEIEIVSNVKLTRIYYIIFARNKIIRLGKPKVPNTKTYKFVIQPSNEMIPSAKLIAFYVTPGGEIISDHKVLEFGTELRNFVEIKLCKTESRPSNLINISVASMPMSYVGLLGVDQSVLLLKSGNDLDKSLVTDELTRYMYADSYNNDWGEIDNFQYYTDFSASEVFIITNANEEYRRPIPFYPVPVVDRETGGFAPTTSTAIAQTIPQTTVSPEKIPSPTEIATRKNFPETWLFDCIENISGNRTITRVVPDTITSWIITGFAMDFQHGLGLTREPTKLNVFMPFFVSLNLPYSIKRGEIIAIQAIVFNYLNQDYPAVVTMYNENNEFEFMENSENNQQLVKNVNTKSNSGTSVKFVVKANKVGYVTLKIEARTSNAGDRIEQQLLVEAEGITKYINEAVLIDLRNQNIFNKIVNISVPEDAVPDSLKIEASVIGDILGPTLDNLDQLIQMPYGCGEQNMLNFVPNIIVLDYLQSVNKSTPSIETKAISFMEAGYQRELTYKRTDGSYSAFGNSDPVGSTWLTAFVARSFHQASKYITVDGASIQQALDFLRNVQSDDGSFPEFGIVHHKPMQGGSSSGTGLTAYVLITFLENDEFVAHYKKTIEKAVDNLIMHASEIDDVYTMSIVAYALYLADQTPAADLLMIKLDNLANNTFGTRHWDKLSNEEYALSLSVETSAYALLCYLKALRDTDALLIVKWLVSQRNQFGGFASTQDTVVGLIALSKIAIKISSKSLNIKIDLKYLNAIQSLNVDQSNSLVLQKVEIPSSTRSVEISAKGSGFTIAQISYHFNVDVVNKAEIFILNADVASSSAYGFTLEICVGFKNSERSNMAVMEISAPSGFIFDTDNSNSIIDSSENVKRVDFKNGNTLAQIYFDYLQPQAQCFDIGLSRAFDVADQKPAPIVVYDYYENDLRTEIFYTPNEVLLCDICNNQDCSNICG